MQQNKKTTATACLLAILSLPVLAQEAAKEPAHGRAQKVEHALVGEIKKVDHAGKTMVVKTAEGAEVTLRLTERSMVRGVKDVGKALAGASQEVAWNSLVGTMAVIHYTGEGAEKTALGVKHFMGHPVRSTEGAFVRMDRAAGVVVLKTAKGGEEVFHLGKEAAIETERGTVRAAVWTAKEGERVTVHYTEEAGRKVIHALKHVGHAIVG